MNFRISSLVLIVVFTIGGVFSQNKNGQIKIVGKVTDFNNKPVKNAVIYIDSVRTEVTTNKRGLFKVKLSSKAEHIGVYVEEFGLLSTTFGGERKIDFVFRSKDDKAIAEDMKIGVAYKRDGINKTSNSINRGTNYEEFASVEQLLNVRFPFVRVNQGQIRIGKGASSFNGDTTPLILIEGQRSNLRALLTLPTIEIQNIRIIRRGSEAAEYGSLGASNGVIIVKLKERI